MACGGGGSISVLPSFENYQQNTPADVKIDILFVVDDSGSMKPEQQNLYDNFGDFINFFYDKGFDFRVAVAKTSAYGHNIACKDKVTNVNRTCTNGTSGNFPYYKKVGANFVAGDFIARESGLTPKEFRCGFGNNCGLNSEYQLASDIPGTESSENPEEPLESTLGNGTPGVNTDHILSSTNLTKEDMIAKFEKNILVGLAGTGDERALESAETVIRNMKQFYPSDMQFPRPNSHLAIIHVGDENDGPVPNNLVEGSTAATLVGSNLGSSNTSTSSWGSLRSSFINNKTYWPNYVNISILPTNTNKSIGDHLNSVNSYFEALKKHESTATVSVHAIQDLPSQANVPYFLKPETFDSTGNSSFGLVGYFQAYMAELGRGLVFSKDSDFGPSLSAMGDTISSLASFFKLKGDVPLDATAQETLQVFVEGLNDGEPIPVSSVNGYQYETEGNLVRFYGQMIPPQGAGVSFVYTCQGFNCN